VKPHSSRPTGERRRRRDPFAQPLDHALERLRAHGLPYKGDERHPSTWHAVCPSCRVPDWTLTLREHRYGGSIALQCAAGCTKTEIHDALERDPADTRIEAADIEVAQTLELAEQARGLATRALALATRGLDDPSPTRQRGGSVSDPPTRSRRPQQRDRPSAFEVELPDGIGL